MTHRRAPARSLLLALALLVGSAAWSGVAAQQQHGQASSEDGPKMPKKIEVPLDTAWTSQHTVTMADGREIPYTATVGWMPVYNDDREAVASVFYTYYRRSDVQDRSSRPLTFSFNGGPGSGSLWMHLGYTGPRKLKISENGYPVQPYGFEENPHTILDRTDIVYVNPVNTGFSRAVKGADMDQFFGVEDDVEYLAEWIGTFVSRNGRWTSPKFLIGESYGTTRVSGLSRQLQQSEWMYVNGTALVSPTGLGLDREGPVGDALKLPHYTATAWYYDQLPDDLQQMDLTGELLPMVEHFTVQE
ncbi:MAG: carboxypeptidase, partial [Gemmatimonadota bacterium]